MAKKAVDFKNGLFHVPDLIEAARLKAGVDDASVLETPGLVALAGALTNSSDDLHFIGRGRAQRMLLETLVKRLRVERYLNNVPEIRQIPIERPVFIVAPFRAGTTLMHRLLAQDPAHRTQIGRAHV